MPLKSSLLALGFFLCISTGHVYSQNTYTQVPGGLSYSTASTNYLWGVNIGHLIYRCSRPCTGKNWVLVSGRLKQIDASDDEVWGVNAGDNIFKRPVDGSGSWTRVKGGLKHVSASGNGYVWGVSGSDDIYKCKKPCNGAWIRVDGKLKQIDGGEKYVYGVNSANRVYARPVDGSGSWREIPGKRLKHVTASGADNIYGVDTDDHVYSCKKPCVGEYMLLDGRLKQVDGAFDSFVGVTSSSGFVRQTGI